MIDPIIFTIGNFSLRWYGVIVMVGVVVGSLIVERALKRHGENPESIWDALIWVLIPGVVGARLWFVLNATLGGSTIYTQNPVEILKIWHGGLHIFGAFLFGAVGLLYFLKKNNLDSWLFLDAAGPAMLIGQGFGRIANFINQELYGPPTTLPWGIAIDFGHRLPQFINLPDTTRFHPTFAYEMLWNFAAAGLLLWLARRYEEDIKPGTIFSGWLLLAGIGRTWIEFFRPDQPKIGESYISYSMIVAGLMAITGALMLLARYKAINLAIAEEWEEEYQITPPPTPVRKARASAVRQGSRVLGGRNEVYENLQADAKPKVRATPKKVASPKGDRTPATKTQATVRGKKPVKKTSAKKSSK